TLSPTGLTEILLSMTYQLNFGIQALASSRTVRNAILIINKSHSRGRLWTSTMAARSQALIRNLTPTLTQILSTRHAQVPCRLYLRRQQPPRGYTGAMAFNTRSS